MINSVVLVGRLTKDIELRKTNSNISTCTFTLAVDRRFKSTQEGAQTADFINCVAWRQAADYLGQYAAKGGIVAVEGSIQTRNYENQQGQRVYVTEVVADNFQILESRAARESHTGNYSGGFDTPSSTAGYSSPSQGIPNFARDNNAPFGNSSPMDISDDDLPF